MNNTASKLASHPRFRWQQGMLAISTPKSNCEGWSRILRADEYGTVEAWTDEDSHILTSEDGSFTTYAPLIPDLNDPATIGTIEAQARAFYQNLIVYPPDCPGDSWAISRGPMSGDGQTCVAYAATRGECWALAFMEVAGGR
jgi:hypothetical protein